MMGQLIEVKQTMDAKSYISDILETFRRSFWIKFYKKNQKGIFMQDNVPCHSARIVKNWFGKKKMKVMSWPPQSPDLNIIETVWEILLSSVRKREKQPDTFAQMKEALIDEWERFSLERINRLYDGIPKRLKELKKSKGNPTKY